MAEGTRDTVVARASYHLLAHRGRSLSRRSSTIPPRSGALLDECFRQTPELFPPNFARGYELKDDRMSAKQRLPIRRILLRDGTAYSVRPSFLMPYMTARAADVEGPAVPAQVRRPVLGAGPRLRPRPDVLVSPGVRPGPVQRRGDHRPPGGRCPSTSWPTSITRRSTARRSTSPRPSAPVRPGGRAGGDGRDRRPEGRLRGLQGGGPRHRPGVCPRDGEHRRLEGDARRPGRRCSRGWSSSSASCTRGSRSATGPSTTASAYNCAVWVVWRDGPRLDILDPVLVLGSPHAAVRRGGRHRPIPGCLPWPSSSTSAPSAPTSNRSPTRGTRAIASTSWSISSSSPSAASSAAATAPPPSIAGPSIAATWLAQHLALPNGIPSRDCIRRLLMALKPEAFQTLLPGLDRRRDPDRRRATPTASSPSTARPVAARTTRPRASAPLHIVSAWASEEGIALGQVATDAKSNEITAIPQLLEQIDLAGTLITIDAMGCQKEIVEQIVAGGGDCVIAVKDNQPKLLAAIRDVLPRSPGARPGGPPVPVPRDARRRARPHRRAVVLPRRRCRATSRRRRTGRGSRRSATRCGSRGTPTARRRTRCGTTSAAAISAASGSARRCAATGGSSRCTGCWT